MEPESGSERPFPPVASPALYQDEQALRTLGIFTYIWAGLCLMGVLAGAGYVIFGSLMSQVDWSREAPGSGIKAEDVVPTTLMTRFGIAVIVLMSVLTLLHFVAARSLGRKKNPVFIYVSAIIACLSIPFGTILGIFTFIVMTRPEVKALFALPGVK